MDATEGYRVYSPDHLDSSFIISNSKPRELLIMTIDLGEGLKDKIVVYEEDEPRTVARQFCLRHGLGPQIQQALLSSIIENLEFEETQPDSLHESLDGNRTKKYSTPQQVIGRSSSQDKKFNSTVKRRLNFNEERSFTPKKTESPKKLPRGRSALKPNDRMNRSSSRTNCKSKPRNELNESMTFKNSSPTRVNQSCNIGHRLYYKGIKKKEVQNRRIENLRKEKTEKELSGITFRPQLASSSLVHIKRPDEPLENFLIKKAAEKQRALQAKREEKMRSEMKGCTFTPVVDKHSAKLAKKLVKNQSPDRFAMLYNEAGARQERNHKRAEQIFNERFTFRPNTSICADREDFLNRSCRNDDKLFSPQKDIDELPNKPIHSSTRKLFLPVDKPTRENSESREVSSKRCRSTEHLKPVFIEPKENNSKDRNEKILQRVRMERFRKIFDTLGPNESGLLDYDPLSRSTIDSELDSVLEPLYTHMKELQIQMSFDNFCEFMEKFIREVTPEERRVILFEKKPASKQPASCSKSPQPRSETIYERLAHFQKVKATQLRDLKIEQERKLRQEAEISQCTFKPVINKTCHEVSMSRISLFKDNPE